MNSAATVINSLDSLEWNASIYEALSSVSRLALTIRKKANVLRIAYSLHAVNRTIEDFLKRVDDAANGRIPKTPAAEAASPERLQEVAFSLSQLYDTILYTHKAMDRAGLLNNSLTSGQLRKLQNHTERILDLADWLDLANHPEYVNEVFARAATERAQGKMLDLSEVE